MARRSSAARTESVCLDILEEDERRLLWGMAKWYTRRCNRRSAWDLNDMLQAGVVGILRARKREYANREEYRAYCCYRMKEEMSDLYHTASAAHAGNRSKTDDESCHRTPELLGDRDDIEPREQIDWEANEDRERELERHLEPLNEEQRESVCKLFGAMGYPRQRTDEIMGHAWTALGIMKRTEAGQSHAKKLSGKILDLVGRRSGSLVAIELSGRIDRNKQVFWLCRCDCGGTAEVRSSAISRATAKSCGRACPHNGSNKKRADRKTSQST